MLKYKITAAALLFVCFVQAYAQTAPAGSFALSSIKGTESKPLTILFSVLKPSENVILSGTDKASFKIISKQPGVKGGSVMISYAPAANFTGIQKALLLINDASGKTLKTYALNGLSTNGMEGENEAPLSAIMNVLGYKINLGWTGLANNIKPDMQGEEIDAGLFRRAAPGKVEMIPVARYSPDFELPFGYYTNTAHAPELNIAGVLARSDKYPEHQSVNPSLVTGGTSFDPGTATFGFYASGPDHTGYSENVWNMALHPANAIHATRIYPAKDKNGKLILNTYLVCFEEAANGDYNDYVFLVKNVKPAMENLYSNVFNGKDLTGWDMFLRGIGTNKDPDKIFTVDNGTLHVTGKVPGYVITKKPFTDFHLKVDFKWGVTKWPPRQNAKRDAGICYNIAVAVPDSLWPASIECQIQEGDVGDFWMLGFSTLKVNGKVNKPTNHIQAVKLRDNERPTGQWNTVEVISYKGRCVHIVNGMVVNFGEDASVKSGRFLLQSEFSEVFYKNVKIREL